MYTIEISIITNKCHPFFMLNRLNLLLCIVNISSTYNLIRPLENFQRSGQFIIIFHISQPKHVAEECSGLVVECLTGDLGVAGSNLTSVTALCP